MNKRYLRWLTIIAPVTFVLILLYITDKIFLEPLYFQEILFVLIIVAIGSTFFSVWIFRFIDEREEEIRRRALQLEALNTASLALTTELDLGLVLQKVVDISRKLVSARYGALGVLDDTQAGFEQFITSGIPEHIRLEMGTPPMGRGVFSILLEEGKSLRIETITEHDRYVGFPQKHPEMKNLLGVPIVSKGKVIGDLYLADKVISQEGEEVQVGIFNAEDQQILEMFATQVAIAIENARLYRQVQQLAVLEERQRFGMDLHDGVIQSIYAVGLMLEDTQRKIEEDPEHSRGRITDAVRSLGEVIQDIRNYILDLRPEHFQGRNVVQGVEELTRALRANTFMSVDLNVDSVDPTLFSAERTVEILHIVKEALSNIQKHARATEVEIDIKMLSSTVLEIRIVDNGESIQQDALNNSKGNGLRNMRERTKSLSGEIEIGPGDMSGTKILLRIPVFTN